ncbi:hypothetical protein NC653_000644 [Populus alba x Populus x berolinensis]|uniref:Uncharacterized protein n=1 Tax=Populus alba x Populus x berolinensis TaxID=444605 RepID=A0AAD6RJR5_9ROSI|nr:hypothetical protein NC653_000644 [Populus alba x Populus x berolinensis]
MVVNGIPLGTGLSGQNPKGQIQTQLGPDVLGLGFGTNPVIDDILTNSPDLGSQQLGKAQRRFMWLRFPQNGPHRRWHLQPCSKGENLVMP